MKTEDKLPLLRLQQLISPSLPVGAFSYSQGLEWVVEQAWVNDSASLSKWLDVMLDHSLKKLDVPILCRIYQAYANDDLASYEKWSHYLLACRETHELRLEEKQRGRALFRLLCSLDLDIHEKWYPTLQSSQLVGFATAAQACQITLLDSIIGYLFSWLENQILSGVKLIPLGQTDGQKIQFHLATKIPLIAQQGIILEDADIGESLPAFAIASSLHETQYTRLYKS